MIFETHAHYDDERFEEDRDALITSMPGRGVGAIINVGASIESTKTTLALSEKYPFVYAAVGVHPSDISGLNEETFAWLKEQTKKEKVAAVGEIGLDYYWDKEPEVGCTDALVFGENYHSPVVMRDDNRGIPLGKVAGRYDWETNGNVKNADNEASSQSWIMFK